MDRQRVYTPRAGYALERLWRSLKYEEVYLKAYDSVAEAKQEIGIWLAFYEDIPA